MTATRSETMTGTLEVGFPEFVTPPADPIAVLAEWLERATRIGVREPRALALATVDAAGRASSRTVAINEIRSAGPVFSTHAASRKGREMAATGWVSGVLYWRETSQQVILAGRPELLPDADADRLWFSRPAYTHAMSVASRQSEELADVDALRTQARKLADLGRALPRPDGYGAYLIRVEIIEFWANGLDRLHERLCYERGADSWKVRRLQP
jgi:pyridoxamine 5'-phosphate oxidase